MEPCVCCFYSHLLYGNMSENLQYELVYFKELHNEQEYYWPAIHKAGVALVSTITSYCIVKVAVD